MGDKTTSRIMSYLRRVIGRPQPTSGRGPLVDMSLPIKLHSTLFNIRDVSLYTIREALAGESARAVRQKLYTELLAVGERGAGVNPDALPEPLIQEELNCMILAFLNAIQAITGKSQAEGLASRITNISMRAEAIAIEEGRGIENAQRSSHFVGIVLNEKGLISLRNDVSHNPITTAEALFLGNTFMVLNKKSEWHAVCVVPIVNATFDRFALEIDSMGGYQRVLSVDQFLDYTLLTEEYDYLLFKINAAPAERGQPPKPPLVELSAEGEERKPPEESSAQLAEVVGQWELDEENLKECEERMTPWISLKKYLFEKRAITLVVNDTEKAREVAKKDALALFFVEGASEEDQLHLGLRALDWFERMSQELNQEVLSFDRTNIRKFTIRQGSGVIEGEAVYVIKISW